MSNDSTEWGGPHRDRGSGFTHHAMDDCRRTGELPPREVRLCSRFQAHEPHSWGSHSRCLGRIKDVTEIAKPEREPEVPIVEDPNLEPGMLIVGDFDAARFVDAVREIKQAADHVADRVFAEDEPKPTPAQELTSWYVGQARSEVEQLTAKMAEYGGAGRAVDLIQIGQDLAAISGREVGDEEAAELGVYFYLRGKLSRWTAALLEGRRVSDDTLHDIGVYVRMAQRIRLKGGWPV